MIDSSHAQPNANKQNAVRNQGVGFGDSSARQSDHGIFRARQAQMDEDMSESMTLRLLEALLPRISRSASFDREPPGAVPTLLLNSKILDYCDALFRNDSLDDVSERCMVYQALFKFVTSVSEHHATSELVWIHRPVRSDNVDLLTLSFQEPVGTTPDTKEPVLISLRNLAMQSDMLVQRAKEMDFLAQDGRDLLKLARCINGLWNVLSMIFAGRNETTATTDTAALDADADIVIDLPDKCIMASHRHASKAGEIRDQPRGRMKKILTDITILRTSLPQGIYVRFCSDRPDMMKAIIIGPEGTSYENGVFEFDIFCPANYPYEPPKFCLKTTGNGKVNFNPNLYADGKVCLSLLGTWPGQPWDPSQSTLLQVLVSIQAMILCEDPWYNEPGKSEVTTSLVLTAQSTPIRTATRPWVRYVELRRLPFVRLSVMSLIGFSSTRSEQG